MPPRNRTRQYEAAWSRISPVPPSKERSARPKSRKMRRKSALPMAAMARACQISLRARSRSPAPSARAMEDETAPPSAPPDMACMSMSSGNASAMLASALVPSCPINQTSIRLTEDWMTKARALGVAIFTSSGAGAAVSRCRVRSSIYAERFLEPIVTSESKVTPAIAELLSGSKKNSCRNAHPNLT